MKRLSPSQYLRRDRCVFSGMADLEDLHSFKDFPIFMGCTDEKSSANDLLADMNWSISRSTGCIQLSSLIPLDVLYAEAHNEVVGNIWVKHHEELAELIAKYPSRAVFEIGGAHGTLARNFLARNPTAQWTILEPNPHVPEDLPVKVIKGFLDRNFRYEESWDVVVHSQVLEHFYQPEEFMQDLFAFAAPGKLHIFSVPNMEAMLRKFYTNCLNFEHTYYLSEPFIEALMRRNGFEIVEKKYFMKDHSIFYVTRRAEPSEVKCPSLYAESKQLFNHFLDYNASIVHELNAKIEASREPVYLFGGHIFSQFLIGFGLKTDKISGILDNGLLKIGKRMYGTDLWVSSPKVLRGQGPVNVILKAANYNAEIKKDIHENINHQVVYWE